MNGSSCVVTGAADGIGAAITERLLDDGWNVVGVDIKAITVIPGRLESITGDVSDREVSVRAAEAAERLGPLAGWVNNAGIEMDEPAHRVSEDLLRRQIDVNLIGTMWGCAEAAGRFLRSGGGSLVSISSIQGTRGFPGTFAYAATKGGVNALTRQLAIEYAPAGIRVNAVLPGQVRTPMSEADWAAAPDQEAAERADLSGHPRGRIAEPEEVAAVVAFLLSPVASFVSGQEIVVDGAASSRCAVLPVDPEVAARG